MKKQIITFSIMLMGVWAFSQNCILGNAEKVNFVAEVFPANYLLGSKYTLNESKTLNAINLIGNSENTKVQMAVYNDNSGNPGELICKTEIIDLKKEVMKLPVTSVELQSGTYWIMAVYDKKGNHTYINFNADGNEVFYSRLNFGEEMPKEATGFMSFKGQDYTYFLSFDCGDSLGGESIQLFPNPTRETLTISNLKKPRTIKIMNHLQEEFFNGVISPEANIIDVKYYPKGMYFLSIDDGLLKVFIKE